MGNKIKFDGVVFYQYKDTHFYISRGGNVYSTAKKRILKQSVNFGYTKIGLTLNGKPAPKFLHRLLAETFISNPNGLPCVNHIDGNKLNNNLRNIEWISYADNTAHAIANNLWNPKNQKKGKERHLPYNIIWVTPFGQFKNLNRAARAHGTYSKKIERLCNKQAPGYSFIPKNNNETSQSTINQDPKAYPQRKAGSLSNQSRAFT